MVATALFSRVEHHVALDLVELLKGPRLLEDAELLADEHVGSLLLIMVGCVVIQVNGFVIGLEAEEVLEGLVLVDDLELLVEDYKSVSEGVRQELPLVLALLLLLKPLLKLLEVVVDKFCRPSIVTLN